jgi:hypothetical protein
MTIERENKIKKNGPNYEIWKAPILNWSDFQFLSSEQKLKYLIGFGIMAGSTHNTQPEAFSISPENGSISLLLDKTRVLPASDVKGRQACISLGWSVANINLAASYYGISTYVELNKIDPENVKPLKTQDEDARYVSIAKIKLQSNINSSGSLRSVFALGSRRINRKSYDATRNIPNSIIEKIQNTGGDGTTLHLIMRGDPRITLLAELQGQADGYVANNEKFANELADWLLPNDTDSFYGMPGDTFNLDGKTTLEIRTGLSDLSKRNASDMGGFSRSSRKGIESAAFVGMLTCKEDAPVSWINAGVKLGEIANILEQDGISIAIHAGLAEVGFVRSGLSAMSLTREKPVILFRAGYPKETEELPPHSPRADIESFLIK